MSMEWIDCRVEHHDTKVTEQKDSLRKKIHAHRTSKAHIRVNEIQKQKKIGQHVINRCTAAEGS